MNVAQSRTSEIDCYIASFCIIIRIICAKGEIRVEVNLQDWFLLMRKGSSVHHELELVLQVVEELKTARAEIRISTAVTRIKTLEDGTVVQLGRCD